MYLKPYFRLFRTAIILYFIAYLYPTKKRELQIAAPSISNEIIRSYFLKIPKSFKSELET